MSALGRWVVTHPVAALGGLTTLLTVFLSEALSRHLLSDAVVSWLGLVLALLVTAGSWAAHQASTPLADPKSAAGERLVPVVPDTAKRPG